MGVTANIRKELSVCNDCINCKLVVWSSDDDTDVIADRTDIATYRTDDEKYHYAVHCNWLKQKMPAAQNIVKCEGKKTK
jgi:hypothetical protein